MQKIDIEKVIYEKDPNFLGASPRWFKRFAIYLIRKILHIREINDFLESVGDARGLAFIDAVFEYVDVSYAASRKHLDRIPSEGRLVIVSNHPLGGLDGLALVKLVSEVRPDVKIVVNDLLMNLEQLSEQFLPYDLTTDKPQRKNLIDIFKAIDNEEAVIIFPAGAVSRLGIKGVRDLRWTKGALYFAKKTNARVLPIYVKARNSLSFYLFSKLHKHAGLFLLPRELFNKRGKTLQIRIGEPLAAETFTKSQTRDDYMVKLLRRHVKLVGKDRPGIFKPERNVVGPADRTLVKKQLAAGERLGKTDDGKAIYLVRYEDAPDVMIEIGRLREITFRKVGEGTGKRVDLDEYDKTYRHLVLWDDDELDIVGAYRIGVGRELLAKGGADAFYTKTLFHFSEEFLPALADSIELGRSFVQQKYWNSHALDYLWHGIGAFLAYNPGVRYMFGPVSLSASYSFEARNAVIYFYQKWFGADEGLARARHPWRFSARVIHELEAFFFEEDHDKEFRALKKYLKNLGHAVPTLYRQYSQLTEPGGARFVSFSVDPEFNDCVDALTLVEIAKIRKNKFDRYIAPHLKKAEKKAAKQKETVG
ncbi:MAG: GNAT family N-acetyltransferase [Ignavibacteriales bacterium]|nr:GNAT family N-acetyltransferase [Ignavibacteriales bacterium]